MKIVVLGVAHGIQQQSGSGSEPKRQEYVRLLQRLIGTHVIDLICEEISPGQHTLASETKPSHVRWAPIVMSDEEKQQVGVPKRACVEPRYLGDDAKTELLPDDYQQDLVHGWVQIERRDPTDADRDAYMFERTLQQAGDAKSILVICGFNHLDQLAQKFKDHQDRVEKDALFHYPWFLA